MSPPVFISYARGSSRPQAQALATRLGSLAWLDTGKIDDGDEFPPRVLDGLLDARVVVIFATAAYLDRPVCRLEMRLALASGDAKASHLVVAVGDGGTAVLDMLPTTVADQNWPDAESAERLQGLVEQRLRNHPLPLHHALNVTEARKLSTAFLEESRLPPPQRLDGISALPPGIATSSLGERFVGRGDALRTIHRVLSAGAGTAARLTTRLVAGGGFGKTRLAIEYLYRYASSYSGGVFWIDAAASDLDGEYWRVLSALDPQVPDLAGMRRAGRDVRRELERVLRAIRQPALYVIDNIPEADPTADPPTIGDFCPAVAAVTILATSRQDTREQFVRNIMVDTISRDAAILLLTDHVPGASVLVWEEWGQIAGWVGDLPIALDLLNVSLALGSIRPLALLAHIRKTDRSRSATEELDQLREALRGQVPEHAVHGITETFLMSFEKLDPTAQSAAHILAQLAPTPIPDAFMTSLTSEDERLKVRATLRSRHFITGGDDQSFGTMHRLVADFLRSLAGTSAPVLFERASATVLNIMTLEHCRDPRYWPLMRLCRPHAEMLFARGERIDAIAVAASASGHAAALLAFAEGDWRRASHLGERVVEVRTRLLGEEHSDTQKSMNNLAATRDMAGDYASARHLHERVVKIRRRVLGEEHPDTLTSMNNLAGTLSRQGEIVRARQLDEHVIEVRRRVLGEEHPDMLDSMNSLAQTLTLQGDYASARHLHERVVERQRRVLGEEHSDTLASIHNLAVTLARQGDTVRARQLFEQVVEVHTRVLGEEHPATLHSMRNLAQALREQGDEAGARQLFEHISAVSTRVKGAGDQNRTTSSGE